MHVLVSFYFVMMAISATFFAPVTTVSAKESSPQYQEVYGFGSLPAGSQVNHSFTIPNRTDGPVWIERVSASCDSIHILSHPQTLLPRKKGALEVRLLPSQSGPLACDIRVETSSSNKAVLLYQLKGKVEGRIPTEKAGPAFSSAVSSLLTRKVVEPDGALRIPVEAVKRRMKEKPGITLVDVRKAQEYDKCRITGSLNVPVYAVKTKEFLKNLNVVLVAEGKSIAPLEAECARLRGSGFTIRVLDGGLKAWIDRGGPIEGDASALSELNRISPATFFEERHYTNWIALNMCESRKEEGSLYIPESTALRWEEDSETFLQRLKATLGKHNSDSSTSILIFSDSGTQYGRIAKVMEGAGIRNVFFLQGGLEGYRGFLEQQASLIGGGGRSVAGRSAKRCSECP